jgi:hypothetical protein
MKKTTPAENNIVVQNITIKTVNRKTQDIDNWKNAIKQFDNLLNPSRVLLYDLYTDITLDGQIESTWGKRQDMVLNKDLLFVKDGVEDEELNKLLNSSSMRLFIKELHNSIAWGYTLIQVNSIFYNEEEEQYVIDFDLIPRKHVHPERNFECVSKDQSFASKDILFKEPPLSRYMIWAGESTDMGLLVKAAQYVIYKRGDFGDWAQFAEMFGMPFREGRYDDYDEKTRVALEQAMEAYGGATYAILPKGAEFKLHENGGNSGSSTLYKDLYSACNAEISKIILGNTLTTEQGDTGAKALGTVHADAETAKNKSDEKYILDTLNSKFKAILKVFGFNVQGGQIWYKSAEKDWEQLGKKWTVVSGIANKVPVGDDFIYEEFDIPKPDNYDQLKEEMATSNLNDVITPLNDPLNKKPTNLKKRILDFFV